MGPPASGKSTLSPLLAERLGIDLARKNTMLRQEMKEQTPEGLEILQWRGLYPKRDPVTMKKNKIPLQFFIKVFNKRFSNGGWVFEGGPKAEEDFHNFQSAGIYPHKVIYLEVPFDVRVKRIQSRRVDPVTERTYNLELNPPEDSEVLKRLIARNDDDTEYYKFRIEKYERNCKKVVFMYPPEMIKIVRADRSIPELLEEILEFVNS